MKIESSFVDTYDLQHAMDQDWLWVRKNYTKFSSLKLPDGVLAAIQYVGRQFLVTKEKVTEVSLEHKLTEEVIDEPIVLVIPTDNGGSLVMVNPPTIQLSGVAKVESNPYRMHQEIETFLANRGKLIDVRDA